MEYREGEVLKRGGKSVICNYNKRTLSRFCYDPTAGKLVAPVITNFLSIIARNLITIILYATPNLICLTSSFSRIAYSSRFL